MTVTGSSALAAPSPGCVGSPPSFPGCSAAVGCEAFVPRCLAALDVNAGGSVSPAESHIWPAGPVKTALPSASTARSPPPAPGMTLRPWAEAVSLMFSSSGLCAASAVLTTRTSRYPSAVAVSCRSTPLRTLAYVAVAPFSAGVGSVPGQPNFMDCSSLPNCSMPAPGPPPEKSRFTTALFGPTVPSVRRSSVVSISCHEPSGALARWGVVDCVSVNVPSGLATVCE